MQCREKLGKEPDMVVCTHAGGGMLTGTARGLIKAGCKNTQVVGASIDLTGLHMASDTQFNKSHVQQGIQDLVFRMLLIQTIVIHREVQGVYFVIWIVMLQ